MSNVSVRHPCVPSLRLIDLVLSRKKKVSTLLAPSFVSLFTRGGTTEVRWNPAHVFYMRAF